MKRFFNCLFLITLVSAPMAFADDKAIEKKSTQQQKVKVVTMQKIEMQTTMGKIVLELDAAKAPNTVKNFMQYVNDGFFDGTIFHRVINGFMVQGGGFNPDYTQKDARAPVDNEANNGLKNDMYTIAMARTNDPHSATAQFFINVADNDFLNFKEENSMGWGYAVFGKVVEGTAVVDKLKGVATGSGGPFPTDVPVEQLIIEKVVAITAE